MTTRDSLLAALVATIWGFNFVVIDWGMTDVPPLLFVALRFTAVVLPAIFFIKRPDAPPAQHPRGRGVHVVGPVRLPVRRHVGRHAARTRRPGAPGRRSSSRS
ncbi:EamA family transporter [Nocardioides sp. B-3]|uniref:EamA family transporter n=1 Tax=Nocardioides sp. B-3 TaxID=2895565 RepID=UPI002153A27A|nr:EamA family transporter [Nocardioides sp. B-3]UUZ58402.1 EamA family transporter [Nocardioides sp. B-3]